MEGSVLWQSLGQANSCHSAGAATEKGDLTKLQPASVTHWPGLHVVLLIADSCLKHVLDCISLQAWLLLCNITLLLVAEAL